jgi:siroheme synthase-like protein
LVFNPLSHDRKTFKENNDKKKRWNSGFYYLHLFNEHKYSADGLETVDQKNSVNRLFPVFLKLESLRLLIVGGGYVGLEKLQAVLQNAPEAGITLVAAQISDEIKELATGYPTLVLVERPFEPADIDGADLVIVAINDREISKEIQGWAKIKGKLANVADTPDLCDFYLGSIVQKGNLKLAISTNGKSPTIAKRIKEVLNDALPEEINELLDHMELIRGKLKGDFTEKVRELNDLTRTLVKTER